MIYPSQDQVVYKGMTESQLNDAFNVYKWIPNFDDLLQKNRERAQLVKAQLNPIQDVPYGRENIQKLDIYVPPNVTQAPVLISIHGGGWMMGSKNPWAIPAETLMSKGVISVAINYGLAPQYRMKEIIDHVRTAVAWVYNNISSYGGNPQQIYIYGVSAGAHLASTTLMTGWHEDYGLPNDVIKGIVAMSGIYDICTLFYAPQSDSQKALQVTLEEAMRDSTIYHPPEHPIPAIIAYGEKEPLIPYFFEAQNYAFELYKSDCNVSIIEVSNANHYDVINELAKDEGKVFQAFMKMVNSEKK